MFGDEPERTDFLDAISAAERRWVSAGSWIEFGTVLVRKLGIGVPHKVIGSFAASLGISTQAVDADQLAFAAAGYAAFGRGTGHRARLNFGDCFAYALAKATGEPLLFKGNDFNHTDLLLDDASSYER